VFVDDANSATAAGWWVADIWLAADFRAGGWLILPVVGIENLFDRRYVGAVAVNGAAGRYYEPAADRTFYTGLTLRRP